MQAMKKYSCIKIIILSLTLILLKALSVLGQNHEFGNEGQKGLTGEQLKDLKKGKIVFCATGSQKKQPSLIEASIIFDKTPQESWDLLSKDELEIGYGIYVYHVDAPGIGDKIGKFAVIK